MTKVCVLQTDNRPRLDYLLKTQEVNKKFCNILLYEYVFIELDNNKYGDIHPATKKINVVNDYLENTDCSVLVFLDSDAWIQNPHYLRDIIDKLLSDDNIHGCFSRDPYIKKNTFINSGSFIIKNDSYVKQMYKTVIKDLCYNQFYHSTWPFDQYYISKYVYDNKEDFRIFVPDILNTPLGKVLRHNWCKNVYMYNDLNDLISIKNEDLDKSRFIESDYYDKEHDFPNTNEIGYCYFSPFERIA
jgi:hypothetical protein